MADSRWISARNDAEAQALRRIFEPDFCRAYGSMAGGFILVITQPASTLSLASGPLSWPSNRVGLNGSDNRLTVELLSGQGFSQLDRWSSDCLDLVYSWLPFGPGLKLKFHNSPVELELGRVAAKRFEELIGRLRTA